MRKIILVVVIAITLLVSGCENKDDNYTKEEVNAMIAEINARDEIIYNIYKDKTAKSRLLISQLEERIIELENE